MARCIGPAFTAAAAVIVMIGVIRPAPPVMVTAISAVLLVVWLALFAVGAKCEPRVRFLYGRLTVQVVAASAVRSKSPGWAPGPGRTRAERRSTGSPHALQA